MIIYIDCCPQEIILHKVMVNYSEFTFNQYSQSLFVFVESNESDSTDETRFTITINNSDSGIDTQAACGSFTWIDGNTYTASNNTATFTIPNGSINGCDSIVTLDLTINNICIRNGHPNSM